MVHIPDVFPFKFILRVFFNTHISIVLLKNFENYSIVKGSLTVCTVTAWVSNYGRVGRMGNNHDNNYENNHGSNTVIRDQL